MWHCQVNAVGVSLGVLVPNEIAPILYVCPSPHDWFHALASLLALIARLGFRCLEQSLVIEQTRTSTL